jgi:erythromycin esterase-like protein
VLEFINWLRSFNDSRDSLRQKVGFHGLDLYSLHTSIAAVLSYLDSTNESAAARARKRYSCFDHFGSEPQRYGYATSLGLAPTCEREALAQLLELQRVRGDSLLHSSSEPEEFAARDAHFFAEQNARLVGNAERYYRMMFTEGARSWNFRDQHMMETLVALTTHLEAERSAPKIVVWAHNSHLGDARATDMSRRGELNLGQLVRESMGSRCVSIGFTTYSGTVTAASDWDAPAERKIVRAALPDSYEALMHQVPLSNFCLDLNDAVHAMPALGQPHLERAIGVIYRPETERQSHYFLARLPEQFDALVHFDETRAVLPLDAATRWPQEDAPETFPSAL